MTTVLVTKENEMYADAKMSFGHSSSRYTQKILPISSIVVCGGKKLEIDRLAIIGMASDEIINKAILPVDDYLNHLNTVLVDNLNTIKTTLLCRIKSGKGGFLVIRHTSDRGWSSDRLRFNKTERLAYGSGKPYLNQLIKLLPDVTNDELFTTLLLNKLDRHSGIGYITVKDDTLLYTTEEELDTTLDLRLKLIDLL